MKALSLDRLPEVILGEVAPEVRERCPEAREFLRLRAELTKAISELREVVNEAPAAAKHDRDALAAALAAGRKDPGDVAHAALVAKAEAARRRVDGFALAHAKAHHVLTVALAERADTWTAELEGQRDEARARYDELAAEVLATLAAADRPRRAQDWLSRATDVGRRVGGLPSVGASRGPVTLGATPWSPEQVLAALRETV